MMRQIDWRRAAEICAANPGRKAYAGMLEDMEWTSGMIFDGERRVEPEYVYACSFWATPVVVVEEPDGSNRVYECATEGGSCKEPEWWAEP